MARKLRKRQSPTPGKNLREPDGFDSRVLPAGERGASGSEPLQMAIGSGSGAGGSVEGAGVGFLGTRGTFGSDGFKGAKGLRSEASNEAKMKRG